MPARHYAVDYSINSGPWITSVNDEAPGPDRTLTISGLGVGTYAGKLRLRPLTGDPTPIISNEFIFQVGVPAITEPVQIVATSSVTMTDVASLQDKLLAAIGVTATPANSILAQDNVEANVTTTATEIDIKVLFDNLITAVSTNATEADQLQAAEQLVAAATAQPTATDIYHGTSIESVTTNVATAATITDIKTMLEHVIATITAQANSTDGKISIDSVQTSADVIATEEDVLIHGVSAPSLVTGITANTNTVSPQISAGWAVIEEATSYNVYYSTDPTWAVTSGSTEKTKYNAADNFPVVANMFAGKLTGVTVNQKILTGLTPGVTYFIRIAAVNAAGEGPLSAAASAVAASYDQFAAGIPAGFGISASSPYNAWDGTVEVLAGAGEGGAHAIHAVGTGWYDEEEGGDVAASVSVTCPDFPTGFFGYYEYRVKGSGVANGVTLTDQWQTARSPLSQLSISSANAGEGSQVECYISSIQCFEQPHGSIIIDSSGTWVAPPNVFRIKNINLWSAGASASGGASSPSWSGAGGNWGLRYMAEVTPGVGYPITIGVPPGSSGNLPTVTSAFDSSVTGPTNNMPSSVLAISCNESHKGGAGIASNQKGGGSSGGPMGDGIAAVDINGASGAAVGGGNGGNGSLTSIASDGAIPGGGGGAATFGGTHGKGGSGRVTFEW